jgi:hypothetical protein
LLRRPIVVGDDCISAHFDTSDRLILVAIRRKVLEDAGEVCFGLSLFEFFCLDSVMCAVFCVSSLLELGIFYSVCHKFVLLTRERNSANYETKYCR